MAKKIIVTIVLLIIIASLYMFVGCNVPENKKQKGLGGYEGLGTHEGLDAETELEIIKYYAGDYFKGQESIDMFNIGGFYGIYDGYVMFSTWVYGARPQIHRIINSLTFRYPSNSDGIKALKDNVVYDLQELYDDGKLSREDLEILHTRYTETHRYWYGDFGEHEDLIGLGSYEGLDAETELKIIKMVYDTKYNGQESVDAWNFCGYYHGVYDGYVVFRYTSWEFACGGETIDGLDFASGEKTVAWKDGKIWRLKDLYDSELISREALEKIFNRHKELHIGHYSD